MIRTAAQLPGLRRQHTQLIEDQQHPRGGFKLPRKWPRTPSISTDAAHSTLRTSKIHESNTQVVRGTEGLWRTGTVAPGKGMALRFRSVMLLFCCFASFCAALLCSALFCSVLLILRILGCSLSAMADPGRLSKEDNAHGQHAKQKPGCSAVSSF